MSTINKDLIPDTFRFERNIANYPAVFAANYQEDANLILSIVGYISANFRNNLYGYTEFRVSDFCKKYGYHKNHLCDTHPLFKYLDEGEQDLKQKGRKKRRELKPPTSEDGKHVYKSVIDYCLYRMGKENIHFSSDVYDDNFNKVKYVSSDGFLQLIKNIKIINATTRKGQEEYVYQLTLGDELLRNIASRYFIQLKEQNFIDLGKHRAGINKRGLFLYLLTEYHRCLSSKIPTNISTPNFNLLCKHAMLKNKQVRNNKQTLIKYLDLIGDPSVLNFTHNLNAIDLDNPKFKIIIEFQNMKYLEDFNSKNIFNKVILSLESFFYNEVLGKDKAEKDELYFHHFQLWINSDKSIPDIALVIQAVYETEKKKKPPIEEITAAIVNGRWESLLK